MYVLCKIRIFGGEVYRVYNGQFALQCVDGVGVARGKLAEALQIHFDFKSFRPGQLEALLAVAHGKDAFVRIPTGEGSRCVCFWFPCPSAAAPWVLW